MSRQPALMARRWTCVRPPSRRGGAGHADKACVPLQELSVPAVAWWLCAGQRATGNGNGQRATGNGPSATASPRDAQVIFAHARAVSQRDYVW